MADHAVVTADQGTVHRELITHLIEHHASWRQSLSCDLNQLLTLRELARLSVEPRLCEHSTSSKV